MSRAELILRLGSGGDSLGDLKVEGRGPRLQTGLSLLVDPELE